jgi:hypothetical protein
MADPPPYPGPPRWVKAIGIVVLVLALIVLVLIVLGIGGPHGPGRHDVSGGARNAPLAAELDARQP